MGDLSYILCALLVWNLIVFFLYGADKNKAKKGRWRISERSLLMAAFFMGGIGAVFGMFLFRHKTEHWKFKILLPLFMLLNIAIAAAVCIYWLA